MLQNQINQRTSLLVADKYYNYYLDYNNIISIQAAGSQVCIHTRPGFINPPKIVIAQSLKDIEEQLNPAHFVRTHNSWVVNMKFVCMVCKQDNYSLKMTIGDPIPISRESKPAVLVALERFHTTNH